MEARTVSMNEHEIDLMLSIIAAHKRESEDSRFLHDLEIRLIAAASAERRISKNHSRKVIR